jgi:mono/diheme cytochrome c family protein
MKITALLATALLGAAASAYAAEAPDSWAKNCAACHGKDGAGHTPAGKKVGVKDLTDAAYQKTFSDDQAATSLKQGLKDKSGKDQMKPFADKLTDDEIKTLVAYVRTLQK